MSNESTGFNPDCLQHCENLQGLLQAKDTAECAIHMFEVESPALIKQSADDARTKLTATLGSYIQDGRLDADILLDALLIIDKMRPEEVPAFAHAVSMHSIRAAANVTRNRTWTRIQRLLHSEDSTDNISGMTLKAFFEETDQEIRNRQQMRDADVDDTSFDRDLKAEDQLLLERTERARSLLSLSEESLAKCIGCTVMTDGIGICPAQE